MPVYTLEQLSLDDERRRAMAARLGRMRPGLVLATGQASSGKVTTLAALAHSLVGSVGTVALLSDRPGAFAAFHPLPGPWHEIEVAPTTEAWTGILREPSVCAASLIVVSALTRESVPALLAARTDQWVLAAVDTPLMGIDAAYALGEMGLEHATLIERVRCIWSQLLVRTLCPECAVPAQLSPNEIDALFPAEPLSGRIRAEVGCVACEGRGTSSREAVCEIVLIDEATRGPIASALRDGAALRLAPEWHVTVPEQARRLVAQGIVGVGTYRRAVFGNPLLRAQNALEREQSRSSRLDTASRHKSEFLANMSHELRTPLNAIIGFSEVLMNGMAGPISDKQREFVGDVHASGRHLLSLINDILDLSKIEAGKMELNVARFSVPVAIDNAMTLVRGRADRHGIRLETQVAPEVGEYDGDERKFKQILVNLLTNAVKFTPEGGTVTLAAGVTSGAYEVSVRDTGVGIAEADHEKVFEEFRQVGSDAARKAEGTGLGLSLTRRLVELHGGNIRLASAPGEGSIFTVTLPIR